MELKTGEKCPPEEFEEIKRDIYDMFGAPNESAKESKMFCIPPGMRLVAEKSDSCQGCIFEGLNCKWFVACVMNGESYIYKLQEAS